MSRAQPWLLGAEAEHNLILGVAHGLIDRETGDETPGYFATAEERGQVVGCAFRTPPHQLGLTRFPAQATAKLADDVAGAYEHVPGVTGPASAAEHFAAAWVERRGGSWHVRLQMRIHELRDVVLPTRRAAGRLRRAAESEIELANAWAAGFVRDAGIVNAAGEFGERLIRAGSLYFWDDGGAKSMVGSTRNTPNGACVNAVYTPPEHRGRGYATMAVAAFSRKMLDDGYRFCCLYTDQSNPTSNAIYRRIGYRAVCDAVDIDFRG